MRREGQLVDSAGVDVLNIHWLHFQEVLHNHSAQLIAWGKIPAVNQTLPIEYLCHLIPGCNVLPKATVLLWCGCQATVVGEHLEESTSEKQA